MKFFSPPSDSCIDMRPCRFHFSTCFQWCISITLKVERNLSRITFAPFCWLPILRTLKSEAISVGNKPYTFPSVRSADDTSRNK
ncbi:hypothetical protein PO304_24630 [Bacteroides ovatus]|nr:hypothetical protein [Bacteroides ovatus]